MIKNIAVLGAGTMGHSIAGLFAIYGYHVTLHDVNLQLLNKAVSTIYEEMAFLQRNGLHVDKNLDDMLLNLTVSPDMKTAVRDADYVIEATFEDLTLKQQLFQELDLLCKREAILASNTSTLPLEKMMEQVSEERRERMMVCHWYNPAHIIPIAELSYFGNMPDHIYEEVAGLYKDIGKQIVRVKKDVPGLVANRIQQVIAREVFSMIENGVADAADVERALTFGPAFRFATSGQLTIADFGGLDIWTISLDNILPHLESRIDANPILRTKIKEGKLGFKTGEGFFQYPSEERERIKERYFQKLVFQAIASKQYSE